MGKGDTPRPMFVSKEVYDLRWKLAFGEISKKKFREEMRMIETTQRKERPLRFVFINDDSESRRQWKEWAKGKGFSGYAVESALEASKIPSDYYVFDVSAIGGMFDPHICYSPICKIIETCPGATIVIVSGMSKNFIDEIIQEIKSITGVTVLYGGWGTFQDFEKAVLQKGESKK